jgi:hypothetical protein
MPAENLAPPLLDETNAGFITSGVSINASSRTDENIPVMGRVAGCRVSTDRRTVTLFLSNACAPELIEAVRKSGQIAVVFSSPLTAQALQLKGADAAVVRPQDQDFKVLEQHCDTFVTEVCPLDYTEAAIRAYLWFDPADICAVTFTPREAFVQTPGPRAGEPLKGGSRAHAG